MEKCSVFYFENGVPNIYSAGRCSCGISLNISPKHLIEGDLSNDRELLKWVKRQFEGDDIEEVNAVVIDKIARGDVGSKEVYGDHNDAAVLFCEYDLILLGLINRVCVDKKGDSVSSKILKAMENIDDECEEQGIIFVKVRTKDIVW